MSSDPGTPIASRQGSHGLARRGVIVKSGGALETLARAETVLLDKTGTVTTGQPRVLDVHAFEGATSDEVVRLAASLDQVSAHVFAPTLIREARGRGLSLSFPTEVSEAAGDGISGMVDGRHVRVGRDDWAQPRALPIAGRALKRRTDIEGTSAVSWPWTAVWSARCCSTTRCGRTQCTPFEGCATTAYRG